MESPRITRALISVSDKTGLTEFAQGLAAAGVEILSTGGTRTHLEQAGVKVCDVSAYTGFPEIMDGRVKTLHPKVHGGILWRHDHAEDREALETHGISSIELVVVNLYPFQKTVAKPDVSDADAIENIDIGGPSLIRGAAKNHKFTTVVTGPEQYAAVLSSIRSAGGTSYELRRDLAGRAYAHTAQYDRAIADYFAGRRAEGPFPATLQLQLERTSVLRYGENPHQRAALYVEPGVAGNVAHGRLLHGKELSYNNLLDLDSALNIVRTHDAPAAAVIKHNNPCGAAAAASVAEAVKLALAGDPLSAFGGILGINRNVDAAAAEILCEPGLFIEAIVAPGFDADALEMLVTRPKWKMNVRLVEVGPLPTPTASWEYRRVDGGLLMQDADVLADPTADWLVVTNEKPTAAQDRDLKFAWAIVRHVKSNAIVLVRDQVLVGTGAGQMSRVDSVEIALRKAGPRAVGAALASDAFFPFPDSVEQAAAAGVKALIQPGGSKKDGEVTAAADRHGLAMIFTGRRHFKH